MGDLFAAGPDISLAHCVSRDLEMGKGIAVRFKNLFGRVDELRAQEKDVGQVAVLPPLVDGDKRHIFYLITKERYFGKPTYATL